MLYILPLFQPLEEVLQDCLDDQHMVGVIQYPHMEEDETIRIPAALSDSELLRSQHAEKAMDHIPFQESHTSTKVGP